MAPEPLVKPHRNCRCRTLNWTSTATILPNLWRANGWQPNDTWVADGGYATGIVSSGLDMDAIEPAFGNGARCVWPQPSQCLLCPHEREAQQLAYVVVCRACV
jgi:hypothetical protein